MTKQYSTYRALIGALTAFLWLGLASATQAQGTNFKVRYYLLDDSVTAKNEATHHRSLRFYRTAKKLATSKTTVERITTTPPNGTPQVVERKTEVLPEAGDSTKFRRYGTVVYNPREVAFRVEHKKDTLFLTPIPFTGPPAIAQPLVANEKISDPGERFNEGRIKDTFYIPISKKDGYTVLHFKYLEVGALTIPFRVYTGKKLKPSIGAGVAGYVGGTYGNRYYYDDGTSIGLTHTLGGYLGFSKITVNSKNTDPQVTEESDEPALSIGGTYLFGRDDFKIGTVVGIDVPLTGSAKKWDYAYHPYIGAVLSLSLSAFEL